MQPLAVVMLGATGAVGTQVAHTLVAMPDVASHRAFLPGHRAAVCTCGVGEPSKTSREEFVRIDKLTVLAFASACREAGVSHFELLGSVGASASSRSFYLRTKGELEEELRALGFDRLSLFRPSIILTPTNRYGVTQAIALAIWPIVQPLLVGALRRFRGIAVDRLGRAIALNLRGEPTGAEVLEWDRIDALARMPVAP